MDQESGSGRRRSSRLAARGVVVPPKPEVVKTPKTEEKPKRSKRKQSGERPSSAAKKLKTEDGSVPLTPEKEELKTEVDVTNNTNQDQVDAAAPAEVTDNPVPPSSDKKDSTNADDDKTVEVKPQDPKEQEKTIQELQEEEKTMDVDVPTPPPEEKKDAEDDTKPIVEVKPVEEPKVQKIEEEPATEAKVMGNGLSAEKEVNKDIQPEKCEKEVKATAVVKDIVTSNGTVDTELKPTNGTGPKTDSDVAVETNEAKSENNKTTPHVSDCEYSPKSIAAVTNASNEITAANEVASTESEKIVDNAVGNTTASGDVIAPNKDQSSTIQS